MNTADLLDYLKPVSLVNGLGQRWWAVQVDYWNDKPYYLEEGTGFGTKLTETLNVYDAVKFRTKWGAYFAGRKYLLDKVKDKWEFEGK